MVANSISHHFETMVEPIVCWYLQGKRSFQVPEVVQDFVHPQYVFRFIVGFLVGFPF